MIVQARWSVDIVRIIDTHVVLVKFFKMKNSGRVLVADHGTFDLSKFRGTVERGPLIGGKHSFAEPASSGFLLKGIDSLSTGSRVSPFYFLLNNQSI